MIALDDYQRLKRKVEEMKAEASRAEGRLEQILSRIKEEFGCKTLAEAKKLLARLTKERNAAGEKYLTAKAEFDRKWKAVLESQD